MYKTLYARDINENEFSRFATNKVLGPCNLLHNRSEFIQVN